MKICFRNRLNRRLSIHVQGLSYDVTTSDGTSTGFNQDSTTDGEIEYTWYADTEGVFLFQDMADIYQPGQQAFREYTVFFHDELEILDKDGNPPVDHRTGLPSSTTAISYRSEPMRNRIPLSHDPADSGEDISMSSWVYGDPAPPILRVYVGDPAKIRLVHGGIKETHVFHLHNHQWRLEAENPTSTIIDSITISPQECYTLDILYGAGSRNGVIGDVIFHCHLYLHFHEGMWTLWRIYDRLEDRTGKLPDGTPVPPLLPLKDRVKPPKKDKLHPGYPNFICGKHGEPPRQPPCGVLDTEGNPVVCPTPLEEANFVENAVPGVVYTDTCLCHTTGKIRMVEEEKLRVEPLVIRANAGARKYETLVERFFADEELRTVFFHNHLFANAHQFHGVFGALAIEEAGRLFMIYEAGKNCGLGRKQ